MLDRLFIKWNIDIKSSFVEFLCVKIDVLQLLYHICLKVVESVLHFQYICYLFLTFDLMFLELENQVKIAVGCIYFQKEIECPILLSMF